MKDPLLVSRERLVGTGLTEKMAETIVLVIGRDERVQRIVLFGSRAKGSYREGSDVDLAVYGEGISPKDASLWTEELEESLFPWSVDVVAVGEESGAALLEHIDRVGITLVETGSEE